MQNNRPSRPPSDRPARPGRVLPPLSLSVGAPDPGPRRREPAANECCMCCTPLDVRRLRTCARRGDSPFCVPCAAGLRASRRAEAASERAYRQAREKRIAAAQREQEKWREKRRKAAVKAWVAERPGRRASDYPWAPYAG